MPEIENYSSSLFVNRQPTAKDPERSPIKIVLDRAKKLAEGNFPSERTIIFMGQRGVGKSWLLQHLYREILPKEVPKLKRILLDLDKYSAVDPKNALVEIFANVWDQIFGRREMASGLTPVDLSGELMRELPLVLQSNPLVLLIDSAYESSWDLLADLENYLLGPLASDPHVLMVITGRGRPYPWKTPEMRLKAKFKQLDSFEKDETKEQLEKRSQVTAQQVDEIYEHSKGNPLANSLLAAELPISTEALNNAINGILETIPDKERPQVREYLEALSVLRVFDEERIEPLLKTYNNKYQTLSYRDAQKIRQTVVKYGFARWEKNKGGYLLDETIRNLLEHYLTKEPATLSKWRAVQCAALQLYQQWSKEYPRTKIQWDKEVAYHQKQLAKQDFSPDDCSAE